MSDTDLGAEVVLRSPQNELGVQKIGEFFGVGYRFV
jgi:hypothetical protein